MLVSELEIKGTRSDSARNQLGVLYLVPDLESTLLVSQLLQTYDKGAEQHPAGQIFIGLSSFSVVPQDKGCQE